MCRSGYGKESIQKMLKEMTEVKNRFVASRENIEAYLLAWSSLSDPLQGMVLRLFFAHFRVFAVNHTYRIAPTL